MSVPAHGQQRWERMNFEWYPDNWVILQASSCRLILTQYDEELDDWVPVCLEDLPVY